MTSVATHADIIDGKAVRTLVDAEALHGARIVGRSGGWGVVVRYGAMESAVAAQRSRQPRLWRNLNTAVDYVRGELGVSRFEVDTSGHDPDALARRRPDVAARLKGALSYDAWARADIAQAVEEARNPETEWIDHEDAMRELTAVVAQAGAAKAPPRA